MKKNFKNKAEEMAYMLAPREIERKTGKDGKSYRIYDDGNFKTMHLFTIEVSLGKHDGTEYWDKVSKVFTDWKEVSTEFAAL